MMNSCFNRSKIGKTAPLILWAFLALSLLAIGSTVHAQANTVAEIGSGTLDRNQLIGPRNTRIAFNPLDTGSHTIRVTWVGDANIRFSLFEIASGNRVDISPSGANPAEWTGELDSSTEYEIFIFAISGTADYTATLENDTPIDVEPNDDAAVEPIVEPVEEVVVEEIPVEEVVVEEIPVEEVVVEDAAVEPNDQSVTVAEIGSGSLNRNGTTAPRNVRLDFDPLTTGTHTIRVAWPGNANIRFSVFETNSGDRVAISPSGANPAEWTGELDGSTAYNLFIFAVSGAASYTATIEAEVTGEAAPEPVTISAQPADVTAIEPEFVEFSVTAEGTGALSYQWFADGTAIAGATDSTLTVRATPAVNGTAYSVEVTDDNGTVTSNNATLTVVAAPLEISAQPANISVTEGDNAVFAVTATGSGTLNYQWFANNTAVLDATNSSLIINSATVEMNDTNYSVEITDGNGATVTSDTATLSVNAALPEPEPEPDQPLNVANLGQGTLDSERVEGPRFVRLNFDSLGDVAHTITVAWDSDADVRFNVLGPDGERLNSSGIQGSNPGVWTGVLEANTRYNIGLFSVDGIANYTATLEANLEVTIDSQPADLAVTEGEDASFTVEASGVGTLSYQWFANGLPLSGETSDTLNVLATTLNEDGTEYTVEVTNGDSTTTSDVAILRINELLLSPIDPAAPGQYSLEADTRPWILDGPAPTLDFNVSNANAGWGRVLLRLDNVLLVGGDFTGIRQDRNSPARNRPWLAAFNAVSGQPVSSFQVPAQIDSVVRSLVLSPDGSQVFVGGDFGLLAVDAITGELDFTVNLTDGNGAGRVFDIAVTDTQMYIGGDFNNVENTFRNNIARLSLDGELDSTWNPNVQNGFESGREAPVQSVTISPSGDALYVGGNFGAIDGTAVPKTNEGTDVSMLVLDTGEGAAVRPEKFTPIVDGSRTFSDRRDVRVRDIAVTEDYVIVAWGGPNHLTFHALDGTRLRQYIGTGDVQALKVAGDFVFVGHHGEFFGDLENPIPAEAVESIDPEIVVPFSFHSFRIDDPTFPPEQAWQLLGFFDVWGIAPAEDSIWISGQITHAGSNRHPVDGLARFPAAE